MLWKWNQAHIKRECDPQSIFLFAHISSTLWAIFCSLLSTSMEPGTILPLPTMILKIIIFFILSCIISLPVVYVVFIYFAFAHLRCEIVRTHSFVLCLRECTPAVSRRMGWDDREVRRKHQYVFFLHTFDTFHIFLSSFILNHGDTQNISCMLT